MLTISHFNMWTVFLSKWESECSTAAVPNICGIRDWFRGRQFFHGPRLGRGRQEAELRPGRGVRAQVVMLWMGEEGGWGPLFYWMLMEGSWTDGSRGQGGGGGVKGRLWWEERFLIFSRNYLFICRSYKHIHISVYVQWGSQKRKQTLG